MVLKTQILGFVVLLALVESLNAQTPRDPLNSSCQPAVDKFISLPTTSSLAALSGLDDAACWTIVESSTVTFDQLNHWAERGNRSAAQYLAGHLKRLDGGNLEDALVALGQFSDHDMGQLLMFAKRNLLSTNELRAALTMLPLSLSDDGHGQLALLRMRRSKVMRVRRKDLTKQRSEAIAAINDFVSEVKTKQAYGAPSHPKQE